FKDFLWLLKEKGAKGALNTQEAVKDADIVFTMLSKPEVVETIMLDEGILYMKKSALWIDCSTINPSFAQHSLTKATEAGINYLEAPVAGTKPQAENAELVFFAGGDEKIKEQGAPYLNYMGNKIIHLGEVGKAASFKLVVNMMLATGMMAFAESLHFGESMGLDKNFLLNTIPNLAVSAPFTKMKAEVIKEGDYDPQFPLELLYKDLHLAAQTAYENHQALPYASAAKELYALAMKEGLGREDMAAIYRFLEEKG
ncbi:MAG: NAD(P)-dependent oxidoreductase, partial [Bacteroidota bacterium]